jgi:anti-anti-sigma regulatory factor
MVPTQTPTKVLTAPSALGLDSRADFRRNAVALLEQLPEGDGQLVIDLSSTVAVDSAGLGALMLVQRRAAERRQGVVLKHANDEIRFLLVLTKLDDLFSYDTDAL